MKQRNFLAAACAVLLASGASAMDMTPSGAFVMGAIADHGGNSLTAGVVWPWSWKKEMGGGEWSAITEASIARWSARNATGRESYTHVALQPLFRYRFGDRSWFAEAGIGISITDPLYVNSGRTFSTRFNFVDTIGFGRTFGANELGLRITHVSNASIKRPNPGEEFLQLRYARSF